MGNIDSGASKIRDGYGHTVNDKDINEHFAIRAKESLMLAAGELSTYNTGERSSRPAAVRAHGISRCTNHASALTD